MGQGLKRQELELSLNPELFERLWPLTEGRRVEKVRYEIERSGHLWEVDVFEHDLSGLVMVEVEFDSENAAGSFIVPESFGREITREEGYKNKNLALSGVPEENLCHDE
jgi:CYTH domain-containing protein